VIYGLAAKFTKIKVWEKKCPLEMGTRPGVEVDYFELLTLFLDGYEDFLIDEKSLEICIFVSKWIHFFMYFIEKTDEFDKWYRKLKDLKAKAKILFRIQKIEENGHFGDCKSVGDGIREIRIHFAKGYRIYFKERKGKIIVLLAGGDKSSQEKDIKKAKEIWNKLNY
jgi:putative addiction module killer protein